MNIVLHTRHRGSTRHHRLSISAGQPVTLGRAWHNDVVLEDEYVDAEHLIIELDEQNQWQIRDLSSRNGTRIGRRRIRQSHYRPGRRISVGDTLIWLDSADQPVPAARARDTVSRFSARLSGPIGLLLLTSAACASVLLHTLLLEHSEITNELLTETLVNLFVVLLAVSLLAGFISKIFRHDMRILQHWAFLCLAFCISMTLTVSVDIAGFNLNSSPFSRWAPELVNTAMLAFLGYGLLALTTNLEKASRTTASLLLAALPLCHSLVMPQLQNDADRWSAVAHSGQINHVPEALFRQPTTLDRHMAAAQSLLDSLAEDMEPPERIPRVPATPSVTVTVSEAE